MVDVSRNVVAVLLVLVIAVSGISMYYALSPSNNGPAPAVSGPRGQVALTIMQQDGTSSAPVSATAGQVVLTIEQ